MSGNASSIADPTISEVANTKLPKETRDRLNDGSNAAPSNKKAPTSSQKCSALQCTRFPDTSRQSWPCRIASRSYSNAFNNGAAQEGLLGNNPQFAASIAAASATVQRTARIRLMRGAAKDSRAHPRTLPFANSMLQILRCHGLNRRGKAIERRRGLRGC